MAQTPPSVRFPPPEQPAPTSGQPPHHRGPGPTRTDAGPGLPTNSTRGQRKTESAFLRYMMVNNTVLCWIHKDQPVLKQSTERPRNAGFRGRTCGLAGGALSRDASSSGGVPAAEGSIPAQQAGPQTLYGLPPTCSPLFLDNSSLPLSFCPAPASKPAWDDCLLGVF